jgi:hypothetical protein
MSGVTVFTRNMSGVTGSVAVTGACAGFASSCLCAGLVHDNPFWYPANYKFPAAQPISYPATAFFILQPR